MENQVIPLTKEWEGFRKNGVIDMSSLSEFFISLQKSSKTRLSRNGFVIILKGLSTQEKNDIYYKILSEFGPEWEKNRKDKLFSDQIYFQTHAGPIWIFHLNKQSEDFFSESKFNWSKETFGSLWSHFKIQKLDTVYIDIPSDESSVIEGALVGIELSAYSYKKPKNETSKIIINMTAVSKKILKKTADLTIGVNLARELVNSPPNIINPSTFSLKAKSLKWPKKVKLEVWNELKLKKEKMNLHLAVGQGSSTKPCLLKIKIPSKGAKKTICFVGKGITFDTGGLDIKPSSAMRLMKKDMGGAACLLGLAWYASTQEWNVNLEFYFALAENAVGSLSFRPSDVIVSRSGYSVEIDNTDAEGRLVLADALDLATKGRHDVLQVIDVATLTGAIKVALGAEVAGLFCNQDDLSFQLIQAGQETGDFCWRMPLVNKYFSSLSSSFADFKNSSEGFGGAITAALFLQKFIHNVPWAHLDIYAWNDKPTGSLGFSGGNGQGVLLLSKYLENNFSK